ncbi:thiazole tautomerase TenI [Paenibacillus sp. SYP-B3998]|uniref:Thiazole tautomerase TenI n=1 Tax=Paenibacillus sp. SYP-B3998 TaxID=2678564 RepID=A0A6G3ZXY2_9BACL|nr:thiamine phosphate synthase [Paenibacillus sp. SYP-B3998]NEW06908.1 thiazole tautomerase TenI [Paenibacillus sp. SYP-B3998]
MARYELHAISTGKQDWETLTAIAGRIDPYVTAIHLREKSKPLKEIMKGLQMLLEAGISSKRIYINGYPAIAKTSLLGGVHLQGTTPSLSEMKELGLDAARIGVSVHSMEEAWQREQEGADYIMFGHIFTTDSKKDVPPRGLEQLSELTAKVNIPVIAIGGMTPQRVHSVLEAGASGVAVMSGIWEAKDPLKAVKAYANELAQMEANK